MKKYKIRLLIYSFTFVALIGIIVYSCLNYWGQILDNKKEAIKLQAKYDSLLEDEDTLSNEVVKLQDPEYVAKYAREKYLYTKEGEIIIDMSSVDDN